MSAGLSRGWRKAARDILQIIAGGGLTELVSLLAGGLSVQQKLVFLAAFKVLVTFLHNTLETSGTIGVLLPTPGLIPKATGGATDTVVATVDAVSDEVGQITGTVTDVTGTVIGAVTGEEEEAGD